MTRAPDHFLNLSTPLTQSGDFVLTTEKPPERLERAGFLPISSVQLFDGEGMADEVWVSEWEPSKPARSLLSRYGRLRLTVAGPGHPFVKIGVTTAGLAQVPSPPLEVLFPQINDAEKMSAVAVSMAHATGHQWGELTEALRAVYIKAAQAAFIKSIQIITA